MYITKEINLDVSRGYHGDLITMKQFDHNSRFLRIRLTNNNEPIAISNDEYVLLKVKRIDNSYRTFNCTINDDGTITVKMPGWALMRGYIIHCELIIVDANSKCKFTAALFKIFVEPSISADDELAENEDNDFLTDLMTKYDSIVEKTKNAAEAASSAIEGVYDATDAASAAKEGADNAAIEARNAAADAKSAKHSADTAAINANSSAHAANIAAGAAGDAAAAANTAKQNADTATAAANSSAQSANSAAQNASEAAIKAITAASEANATTQALAGSIGKLIIQDADNQKEYIVKVMILDAHPAIELTEIKEE